MSIGARFGTVTLIMSALAFPALAQGEPTGTWTDPPVRGSAAPQTPSNPEASPAKPAAEAPAPTAPSEKRAAAPEKAAPAIDEKAAEAKPSAAEAASSRRAAERRRETVRRLAARSRAVAEARESRRHAVSGGRESQRERTVLRERTRLSSRGYAHGTPPHRPRYAWRYAEPAYEQSEAGPYYGRAYAPRRAGWGSLLSYRARRIAEARAAGYIVMRSRTYEYPDGSQVRRLTPYGYGDFD